MAVAVEPPQSPLKKSIWKRLVRRDSAATHEVDTPKATIEAERRPQKLRRRGTQIYRDAPKTKLSRQASIHLPLDEQRPVAKEKLDRFENNPTELITVIHVERSEVPAIRAKPRVISLTRVTASDMRTNPFPASSHIRTVGWNVFLTPEKVYSLVMGFKPSSDSTATDDKWFIYSQGPDQNGKLKVHFHRSWTGMKIAELFIVVDLKGEGAGTIVGVKWNGSDQTNGLDEEETKYMVSTTCSWVLGVDLERVHYRQ
ncbi:hypothetical protein CC80DRAFT_111933 [Byssothecium circinans]|uniref:Uncharacterized protein n=1 Tax=Byssothecium circinans TaxID=147558 RepID=A0A6A5TS21_9PLEO|nr:hypothetical protein CC80DRAFT_111933 [Byssothecium circinans]